jgi:hypothetical protein
MGFQEIVQFSSPWKVLLRIGYERAELRSICSCRTDDSLGLSKGKPFLEHLEIRVAA